MPPRNAQRVVTTSRNQKRGRCLTPLGGPDTLGHGTNGYDGSSTSVALVGARNRLDRARICRSGERGDHRRTDFARAWLLCPRAHRNSEVAVGYGRLQQCKKVSERGRQGLRSHHRIRANSSVGQSACLTRRMSGVRVPLRPCSELARARLADPARQVGVPFGQRFGGYDCEGFTSFCALGCWTRRRVGCAGHSVGARRADAASGAGAGHEESCRHHVPR